MSDTTQIKAGVLIILAGSVFLVISLCFIEIIGGITVQNSIGFFTGFVISLVLGGVLIWSGK